MQIACILEHNEAGTLLYAEHFPGAYTRGATPQAALQKMPQEIRTYLQWLGSKPPDEAELVIVQEKVSSLEIRDADSDVLFDSERRSLTQAEYDALKALALKSASDFHALYAAIPSKVESCLPARKTFYGAIPRTAEEMYQHTRHVNAYYFCEIGIPADNEGTIQECRSRGFALLEAQPDFLTKPVIIGSYEEEWSLRKVIRRFLWHDRIHAKAMWRMAIKTFGADRIPNIFCFEA